MDKIFKIIKGNNSYWTIFGLGLLLLIIIQYFGVVYYHYPVPPGHDAMMHWNMAQPFYNGTVDLMEYIKSGAYPPGFLLVIAKLAHLFNADMMDIMLWLTPAILIIAALSIYLLTKELFGRWAGLFAFFLYAFAAKTPIQQLNDGGYPNLIATHVFLPLFALCLILVVKRTDVLKKLIFSCCALGLLVLIPLFHHLSSLYLILSISLISFVGVIALISSKSKVPYKIATLTIGVVGIILAFLVFSKVPLLDSMFSLIKSTINNPDPEAFISLKSIPKYLGLSLAFFGFGGLILLPLAYFKKHQIIFPLLVVILFALILLIGSQKEGLSNPDRLIRDLAVPLSIIGGVFIAWIAKVFSKEPIKLFIALAIILLIFTIGSKNRISKAFAYEPMVRVTDADMQAVNYLKAQKPLSILLEGYSFYIKRFLPEWPVDYLWLPQTQQGSGVHHYNPKNADDLADLKRYNYIYIVDSQVGWTPEAISFGFAENYLDDENFILIGRYQSRTNVVYLFKVIK